MPPPPLCTHYSQPQRELFCSSTSSTTILSKNLWWKEEGDCCTRTPGKPTQFFQRAKAKKPQYSQEKKRPTQFFQKSGINK
jgi:hypothetical protein